jgi:hypothetical protein
MSFKDKFLDLIPKIGETGVDLLSKEFERQSDLADEPWKKSVLSVFADSTQKLGPTGIVLAQTILEDLLDKKPVDISKVTDDLAVASNLLAEMQKAEVKKKKLMRKFVKELAKTLLHLLKAIVKVVI